MDILENVMQNYGITPLPENPVEAMAYIPYQQCDSKIYKAAQALESGTAYPALDKQFFGEKCGGKDD